MPSSRISRGHPRPTNVPLPSAPGLAWPGLAWPGLAWPGLAWPVRSRRFRPATPGQQRRSPTPRKTNRASRSSSMPSYASFLLLLLLRLRFHHSLFTTGYKSGRALTRGGRMNDGTRCESPVVPFGGPRVRGAARRDATLSARSGGAWLLVGSGPPRRGEKRRLSRGRSRTLARGSGRKLLFEPCQQGWRQSGDVVPTTEMARAEGGTYRTYSTAGGRERDALFFKIFGPVSLAKGTPVFLPTTHKV